MADRKGAPITNKSSSVKNSVNEGHSEESFIALRPVDSSWEAEESSVSQRPKRSKRKWPPSPPPQASRSQSKKTKRTEERESVILVKEEHANVDEEQDVRDGDLEVEEILETEHDPYGDGPGQGLLTVTSEELETNVTEHKGRGQGVRSKGQLWQLTCSLPSEEMFQEWKQDSGMYLWCR